MRVLISTRDADIFDWYEAALLEFLEANNLPIELKNVEVLVHLTSGAAVRVQNSPQDSEQGEEKQASVAKENAPRLNISALEGRPDITSAVREMTLETGVTVGLAVCGPAGVLKAAQDAAAEAQLRILNSKPGSKEVYLHSEVFS
jgi:hypothetical protein